MSELMYAILILAIERGFESVEDWQNECPRDFQIAMRQLASAHQ